MKAYIAHTPSCFISVSSPSVRIFVSDYNAVQRLRVEANLAEILQLTEDVAGVKLLSCTAQHAACLPHGQGTHTQRFHRVDHSTVSHHPVPATHTAGGRYQTSMASCWGVLNK